MHPELYATVRRLLAMTGLFSMLLCIGWAMGWELPR
jgi:hypothetical protein